MPLFYTRGMDGLPREWIRRMKASMREVGRQFSSHRMLLEYAERYYLPGLEAQARFAGDDFAAAKGLAAYLGARAAQLGRGLRVEELSSPSPSILKVGDSDAVRARFLAGSPPTSVAVELYHGPLSSQGEIGEPRRLEMEPGGTEGEVTVYTAEASADATGRQGYTARCCRSTRRSCTRSCPAW